MIGNTAYIILGESGSYDDYMRWPIAVYTHVEDAEAMTKYLRILQDNKIAALDEKGQRYYDKVSYSWMNIEFNMPLNPSHEGRMYY